MDAARDSRAQALDSPTDIGRRSWAGVAWRTLRGVRDNDLTDFAAALTYYGVLAVFPALLAVVALLGLIGHSATQPLLEDLGSVAPGPAKQIFTSAIENIQKGRGAAGILFVVALLGAIWSASGYVGAFMRASNSIYGMEEGRPVWKTIPTRVLTTIVLLVLLAVSAVAVVLTGGLAGQVGKLLGVQGTAVTVWDIAKWPVLVLVVGTMFSILYWAAPNVKHPGFRWLSPGGLFAVVMWIVVSAAFAAYVANFGSYNKTYGALGGVIVFLVWLWLSNVAVLLGAKLNAELERERQVRMGRAPDPPPFAESRDAPKDTPRARAA
ncbi:MAG: YihY/virulence factor BrkB family protein [Solirubrobacteraceae bacterium]